MEIFSARVAGDVGQSGIEIFTRFIAEYNEVEGETYGQVMFSSFVWK
jgi:hypothetical protein